MDRIMSEPPDPSPIPASSLIVTAVDDPDGTLQLVGARGSIDSQTIASLIEVLDGFRHGPRLHLDLSAATFACQAAVQRLEWVADALEQRGVKLRIVGVDAGQPAPPLQR